MLLVYFIRSVHFRSTYSNMVYMMNDRALQEMHAETFPFKGSNGAAVNASACSGSGQSRERGGLIVVAGHATPKSCRHTAENKSGGLTILNFKEKQSGGMTIPNFNLDVTSSRKHKAED